MTMSETVAEMSKPDDRSPISTTENGFSAGQEVNKAKDADDSGGGSLPSESEGTKNGVGDSNQPEDQSPNKMKNRRAISFPKDSFVSGYLDPPDPWKNAPMCTAQELITAYRKSCEKHATRPMNKVLQQLETFSCSGKREEKLVLKGEKIDCKHCETLEEIFRRVQFKNVDLESCHLDDECAVALFDMIEYYDSACQLNIAFNKNIGLRGWQACSRLIRRTPSLTLLDMRNCDLNDRSIPVFGRALKLGSHITVLHMENMYLSGRALIILVAALKMNETLQELFLADNRLMPSDGIQLGNLLKYNHSLALLDLRNNHLQDVGVGHICDGLYEQNLDRGLRTLVLWNNQMTFQAMASLSRSLGSTKCLETLNLGHNNVTNEGIHILKDGLLKSKSLMRLGLQSTRLTCEGAVALAEYVADSLHLLRLDLRENDIKTAGLMALSLALKVNESVTRMDLDKETKKESGMKDYADQQRRLQQDINSYLERNQQLALDREEEERRRLEERAQVQVARHEVQSVIHAAQEMMHTSAEVLLLQNPTQIRRPSLLFDASQLTPQETLESPHCGDVHPFFPPTEGSLASPGVVPSMSVSVSAVSSPPMSLDLQHPLSSQSVSVLGVVGSLPLPMAINPLVHASTGTVNNTGGCMHKGVNAVSGIGVLPSPPVELLLSPQYYPKPTARKIFSVSRVIETSSVSSPTVSTTGVLDTGCPPVINSPTMSISGVLDAGIMGNPVPSVFDQGIMANPVSCMFNQGIVEHPMPLLLPTSPGLSVSTGVNSTVSPALLCQDLATKTVNSIIEQLVSDSPNVSLVPELGHGAASEKTDEKLPEHSTTPVENSSDVSPEEMEVFFQDTLAVTRLDTLASSMECDKEIEHLGIQDTSVVDACFPVNVQGLSVVGTHVTAGGGAGEADSPTHSIPSAFDPLGVLQSPFAGSGLRGEASDCDRMEPALREISPTVQGGVGLTPMPFLHFGTDQLRAGKGLYNKGACVENMGEPVTVRTDDGANSRSLGATDRKSQDESSEGAATETDIDKLWERVNASANHVNNDNIPEDTQKFDPAFSYGETGAMSSGSFGANVPDAKEVLTVEGRKSVFDSDLGAEQLAGRATEAEMVSGVDSKDPDASKQVVDTKLSVSSKAGEGVNRRNEDARGGVTSPTPKLHASDSLLLLQGLDNFESDFPDFGADDEDLSLFTTLADKPTAGSSASQASSSAYHAGNSLSVDEASREASTESLVDVNAVISDTWLTVDASSLPELQERLRGGGGEAGKGDKPDFYTALTFNGLTQELASALSSIDESGGVAEDQVLRPPDEFERELDAMLASVKNDLPWPLQQDVGSTRGSQETVADSEATSQSISAS